SFTFYHSNSLLTSVDCYTLLKSKFFATVPLNEHTNGLIRRFLPKGTDFNEVSDKEIAKIEHTLNTRRRASLNYRSPNHVFLEYLMAA
ncbi:transposase, partial [Piscirickettsia salmonis]|uniref:transposase n=1 Tax=Piscirickettsia salmonis TaxID=1238 RepID=UPI0034DD40BD